MPENWYYMSLSDINHLELEAFETAGDRALFQWMAVLGELEKDLYPGVFAAACALYVANMRRDAQNPGGRWFPNFEVPESEVPVDGPFFYGYNHVKPKEEPVG